MNAQIPGIGMYQYLLPALTAWAVRMDYEMPDTTSGNIPCFYTDEFDEDTHLGSHRYVDCTKSIIKIRPGMPGELSTWAHEFAHMIQSANIGKSWHTSYKSSSDSNGYWNNVYEIEAREAGKMADIFEEQGWLFWEVDYNLEGETSVWPRPKPAKSRNWGMSFEMWEYRCQFIQCPWWDSDWYQYDRPAELRYTALVKITLRIFVGYIDNNAVLNMQQYAA